PTACTYKVSGSISLPSPGFFSPFLHSTGSLSVNQEYLALEDGPPFFKQDITCPALLLVSLVPQYGF
ncbi:serine acetyltransferase, partial [Haemophilus influenzae NT127]